MIRITDTIVSMISVGGQNIPTPPLTEEVKVCFGAPTVEPKMFKDKDLLL